MAKLEMSDAVGLFAQQTSITNNLWTVYVVATFAAAGFGLSSALKIVTALAVTIGFLGFTIGHAKLLHQSLSISRHLAGDISEHLKSETDGFESSLAMLIRTANPPWISMAVHALVDLCVVAAIWTRVY